MYLNLFIGPRVHAQGLDLGNMRPKLPMQRRASHAQKDAQLIMRVRTVCLSIGRRMPQRLENKLTLQLAHPAPRVSCVTTEQKEEPHLDCLPHNLRTNCSLGLSL